MFKQYGIRLRDIRSSLSQRSPLLFLFLPVGYVAMITGIAQWVSLSEIPFNNSTMVDNCDNTIEL